MRNALKTIKNKDIPFCSVYGYSGHLEGSRRGLLLDCQLFCFVIAAEIQVPLCVLLFEYADWDILPPSL